jgi:hypothetical protein
MTTEMIRMYDLPAPWRPPPGVRYWRYRKVIAPEDFAIWWRRSNQPSITLRADWMGCSTGGRDEPLLGNRVSSTLLCSGFRGAIMFVRTTEPTQGSLR